jgi:hypothetical protein
MRRLCAAVAAVVVVAAMSAASAVAAPTEVIVNGGFETGDFSGWTVSDTAVPLCAWAIDGCAVAAGGANSGAHYAGNGFDGNPGEYVLAQVVALPAGTATLSWFESEYASYGGAQRTLEVQVRDASGTTVLGTPYSYTLPFNSFTSGWTNRTVDLSSFTGQTIELRFVETIPETYTGPAGWGFDDISLLVDPVATATTSRVGYCLNGKFVDLVSGQPDVDAKYAGATPARWIAGKGITCDAPPAGYTLKGKNGPYEFYAPN